jgi:hypothetical protein
VRSEEELRKLLTDFKGWFEIEFTQPYAHKHFRSVLRQIAYARLSDFCKRRLGHLPDKDFFLLLSMIAKDEAPKPAPVAPVEPEIKNEPAKEEIKSRVGKRK